MKKFLLPLGLLLGLAGTAQAQSTRLGFKIGPSLTNFAGNVQQADYLFGVHAGLLVNLGINENFSVQPEVLYSQKGAQTEEEIDFLGNVKVKARLHYIDVPVLARYQSGNLFFEAGPQLGFLTSARATVEISGLGSDSQDVTDAIKDVDFGYALGFGFQAKSGPMAGLRYNGGLLNIDKDEEDERPRNSAFQLYVGYLLPSR